MSSSPCTWFRNGLYRSLIAAVVCGGALCMTADDAAAQETDEWIEQNSYSYGVNPVRGRYVYKNQAGLFRDREVETYHIRENRFLHLRHSNVTHCPAEGPWYNDTYSHRWNRRMHVYRGGETWSPE